MEIDSGAQPGILFGETNLGVYIVLLYIVHILYDMYTILYVMLYNIK